MTGQTITALVSRIDTAEEGLLAIRAILSVAINPPAELVAEEQRLHQFLVGLKDEAGMCRQLDCRTVGRCLKHFTFSMLRMADRARLQDRATDEWLPPVLVLDRPSGCPSCGCMRMLAQVDGGLPRWHHRAGDAPVLLVPRQRPRTPAGIRYAPSFPVTPENGGS